MEAELVVNALKMACVNRRPPAGVIFHSDRGGQYNSELFKTFCVDHEVIQSMGRTGSCYDNAAAESFFHSLKIEWLHGHEFTTRQAARTAVFEYIETFYNANRRHSTLGYLSPSAFEKRHQQEEADEANRHHAPPRSAAREHRTKRRFPQQRRCHRNQQYRISAIKPPARRSAPAPPGFLLPTGTSILYLEK